MGSPALKAVLFVVLIGSVSANTIRVPADQPTIQGGLNAAADHDTVLVAAGTYTENLNFNGTAIALIGEDGATATFLQPSVPTNATVRIAGPSVPGTVIRGFTIQNGGATYTVNLSNVEVLITDNIFRNNIPVGSMNVEVVSCNMTTATIVRNLFYGNGGIGCVGLRGGSANSKIVNNTFDGNERGFFTIAGGGTALNNIVTHSLAYGVAATDPSQYTLLDYNDVWANNVNYMTGVAGIHDISSDPQYVDVGLHDFDLQLASPCIDAGNPDPGYNDVDGSRNDIGAYATLRGYPLASHVQINDGEGCFLTNNPLITWTYVDTGLTQVAYQVQVGTDSDWSVAEMWDSGEQSSAVTSATYSGSALVTGQTYFLRVRVQDGSGWGVWSQITFWYGSGVIIHVPGDYSTIQAAIDAASSCDIIEVASGTYAVNLTVSGKSVVIRSVAGPSSTTLTAANVGDATLRITNAQSEVIEIRGFTFTDGGATYTVVIDDAAPLIESCVFHHNIPFGSANVEVISCIGASATITQNLFYANGGIGCIGLRTGSQGTRIINNTFDGNERGFFSIASGGTAINNIVTHSLTYGVAANSPGNFSLLDYNDVWANGTDYMTGVPGAHDISADPMYIDPGIQAYGLLPTSPCINAGDPDPQYNDPDGSRSDIGAFAGVPSYPMAVALSVNNGNPCFYTPNPSISWAFVDSGGLIQTGYQVQIGTDSDWTLAEMWDPGEVMSSISAISYGGPPMTGGQTYYVRLRVLDITGWSNWTQVLFLYRVNGLIHVPVDYPTIQDAINASVQCDTIVVDPGTYSENITINARSVILRSSGGANNTIIAPVDPYSPTLSVYNALTNTVDIRGFTFTGGGSTHTVIVSSSSPRFTGNIFHHNIPFGSSNVEVISCTNASALIDRNVFYANGGIGCIGLREGSAGSSIINNTFDGNERGFFSIAGGGIALNNIVTHSLVYGVAATNPSHFSLLDYNDVWANGVDYMTGVAGIHDISDDPDFLSASSKNFALKPGSPCINAGDPSSGYNDPDGSRNDIGALPFSAHPPTTAALVSPPAVPNLPVFDMLPVFVWNAATDPDSGDIVHYKLQVSLNAGFSLVFSKDSILTTSTQLLDSLQFGTHYWWRIISTDLTGLQSTSEVNNFWTWELGDFDKSHNTDIADLSLLIDHLYIAFTPILPARLADVDGDCHIDISDLTTMIDRLYISFSPLRPGCEE